MKSFPGGRGFRPQLSSAPRFRFAPSRSWLSSHSLTGSSAIGQRTSIPLRSISVVAFAACTVEAVRNWAAHLDSASLHLGRGFRHMERNKEEPGEMQALPQAPPYSFPRCSIAARKKTAVPAASRPQKQRFLSARSGVRTLDTLIKSQVLCQLS